MPTQTGTLKAGSQLVIDSIGSPVDYDVSVTGYAVDFKRIQQKNTLSLGPYKVDCSYSITINSGSPSIYKVQPNGQREYSASTLPDLDSLPVGQVVNVGNEALMKSGDALKFAAVSDTNISAAFMLPLKQSGTAANLPIDVSLNEKVTTFGGSMVNPWGANPGWLTTTTTPGTNVYVTDVSYNLKTDSLFFFATIKKTAPSAVQYIMGSGDGSVANNGILLVTRSTGNKLSVRVGAANKAYGSADIADSQLDFIDGTEHQVLCAYDATTATLRLYRDGVLDTVYAGISVTADSYNYQSKFAIGSAGVGDPVPLQTYGVGMFIFQGKSLPKNIDDIARIVSQRRSTGYGSHDPVFF